MHIWLSLGLSFPSIQPGARAKDQVSRRSAVQKICIPCSTLQEPCSPASLPDLICLILPSPISNLLPQTHQSFLCLRVHVLSFLSGCLFSRKHTTKTLIIFSAQIFPTRQDLPGRRIQATAQAPLPQDPMLALSCFFACLSALYSLDTMVIILVYCLLTHCNVA